MFGYREQEKKAGMMSIKAHSLRNLLLSQRSKEHMIFSKNWIESDEIIMHIADDKQSNCLRVCKKVKSFLGEQMKAQISPSTFSLTKTKS